MLLWYYYCIIANLSAQHCQPKHYYVDIIENRQMFNSSNWNSRTHCSMLIKYPFILQTFITFDIQTFWGHISSVSPVVLECKCVMVSGCGPPRPAPGCLGGLLGSLIWRHYCSYRVSRTLSRTQPPGDTARIQTRRQQLWGCRYQIFIHILWHGKVSQQSPVRDSPLLSQPPSSL